MLQCTLSCHHLYVVTCTRVHQHIYAYTHTSHNTLCKGSHMDRHVDSEYDNKIWRPFVPPTTMCRAKTQHICWFSITHSNSMLLYAGQHTSVLAWTCLLECKRYWHTAPVPHHFHRCSPPPKIMCRFPCSPPRLGYQALEQPCLS